MFLYVKPWNAISLNLEHRNVDMVSCSPIIVSVPDGNQRNSSLLPQIGLKITILKFKAWSWSDEKWFFIQTWLNFSTSAFRLSNFEDSFNFLTISWIGWVSPLLDMLIILNSSGSILSLWERCSITFSIAACPWF